MIDLDKKYRTKYGKEVVLTSIKNNKPCRSWVRGYIKCDDKIEHNRWYTDGRSIFDGQYDLVEVSSKSNNIRIDDRVIVWNNDNPTNIFIRHFVRYMDNYVITFPGGRCGFLVNLDEDHEMWDNCELYMENGKMNDKCIINVDLNKKYKTRSGKDVTLLKVITDDKNTDFVIGHDSEFYACKWNKLTGHCINYNSNYNLVEVCKYDHIKIDDKVLVWDESNTSEPNKFKKHFAGIDKETGKVMTFNDGATSWSSNNNQHALWDNCELYTGE